MDNFEDILLEIIGKLAEGKQVDIEDYCNKYPQYRDALLAKFRTAEFLRKNFHEEDLTGKKLGEYLILQELGRGNMGIVFLGIHPALSRLTAIKVLPPHFIYDKEALRHFQEEAKTIAKFNHPNIVPIYSISENQGLYYIAMGYIPGPLLKDIIERLRKHKANELKADSVKKIVQDVITSKKDISQKNIAIKRDSTFWNKSYSHFVATIGAEIANALNYAHQNGVFHGDLKPSNILLTHEGIPMIVDFGLSKDIKKRSFSEGASREAKEFTGTLAYAAPEQIKENIINDKTDIWSLGVTLYELLTFRNPFLGSTVKETADKILKSCPLPLNHYNKKIPVELEAIVLKCLESKPEKRYGSAAELSADLNSYLELKPITARPVGPIGRTVKLFRRRPLVSCLTAGLFVSLIISSVLAFNKNMSNMILDAENTYSMGDYDGALSKYDKILHHSRWLRFNNKRLAEIFSGMGDSYLSKANYKNAENYYQKALKIDSKNYNTISGLGELNFELKNFDNSLEYYKITLKMKPADRYNYYYIGKIYSAKGLLDEAMEYYRRAIESAPEDFVTLEEIASIISKIGLSKRNEIKAYLKTKRFNEKQISSIFKVLQ